MSKMIIREVKTFPRFKTIVESMRNPVLGRWHNEKHFIKVAFVNKGGVCEYHYQIKYPSVSERVDIEDFVVGFYHE